LPFKRKLTYEEKDRLLRIGKRMRKGPFNAIIDPTETGAGSALLELSEAVKTSGEYNIWSDVQDRSKDETVDQEQDFVPKKVAAKVRVS
jgi:nucleolar protein 53